VALIFGQFLGAPTDALKHFFHLAPLLERDTLKCMFDECGVLAEDSGFAAELAKERAV
jgi:hypothetical protein